jgi:hypothetical protein
MINDAKRRKQQLSAAAANSSFRNFSACFFVSLVLFSLTTLYMSNVSITHIDSVRQQQLQATRDQGKESENKNSITSLAGLVCDPYGGPSADTAKEMVYWEDIPSDRYVLRSSWFANGGNITLCRTLVVSFQSSSNNVF